MMEHKYSVRIMVNSKNKGNAFERKIANRLSSRFCSTTGISNAFRRNPDSGSFFGGLNERKTRTHDLDKACFGDIIGPANFRYSVECKHYKQAPSFAAEITIKLLSKGVSNSDHMREVIRRRCKVKLDEFPTVNWNDTPTGKFINEHAHVLRDLVVREVIAPIARKEYRLRQQIAA